MFHVSFGSWLVWQGKHYFIYLTTEAVLMIFICRAIAIPSITSCISVTRYILATRLTPPTNQSILQCFGRTLLGLFGCIGLLITYHLVSESDALTTFCGIVHDSDEKVAPKLTLPSVVPGLLILCCACVAFTADLHLKWFVDEHIQNHGNHHPGTIYNASLCDISQLFLDLRLQV